MSWKSDEANCWQRAGEERLHRKIWSSEHRIKSRGLCLKVDKWKAFLSRGRRKGITSRNKTQESKTEGSNAEKIPGGTAGNKLNTSEM